MKGVRSGVERRRGVLSGLKPRVMGGEKHTTGNKVLKERRSPRRRGRTGTSVKDIERAVSSVSGSIASHCGATASGDGTATRCHSRIFPRLEIAFSVAEMLSSSLAFGA